MRRQKVRRALVPGQTTKRSVPSVWLASGRLFEDFSAHFGVFAEDKVAKKSSGYAVVKSDDILEFQTRGRECAFFHLKSEKSKRTG